MTGWKGRVSFALGAATKWGRETKEQMQRKEEKKKMSSLWPWRVTRKNRTEGTAV